MWFLIVLLIKYIFTCNLNGTFKNSLKHSHQMAGEIVQAFIALAGLAEDPDSFLGTYLTSHRHL